VASGISAFVGLVFAGVILVASLVAAVYSPWWGAVGYATAVYVLFATMVISSWCIQVRKNVAWEELSQLEQYVLYRHRAFFYFPFGASNFGYFCHWTRMFAVLWAIFCVWRGWYLLSGVLAFFYVVSTPMITVWIPIPNYQALVQRGHQWAQERLDAMQHILDARDALGF
jgi:ABC-type transport system involved in Fe-S cluster assembly fused permease/ATPase subunit